MRLLLFHADAGLERKALHLITSITKMKMLGFVEGYERANESDVAAGGCLESRVPVKSRMSGVGRDCLSTSENNVKLKPNSNSRN